MKNDNIRESKFELMRIVSMFMIVVWHVILHGNLIGNSVGVINLLLNFLLCICIVHVNSFILLTGYFQYNKDFSLKKFLKLFNLQWFYRIVIVLILVFMNFINISNTDIAIELLPIGSANYWFINTYLALYLLSPFLNKFISKINQKDFRKCLIVSFLLLSVVSYVTNNVTVTNNGLLLHFIFLYFLGAYLHKYPIRNNWHFKLFSKEKRQLIFIFGSIFFLLVNFMLLCFGTYLSRFKSGPIELISSYILSNKIAYYNPFVILQTICYFLYFETLQIKSKFINAVSLTAIGIYLIHDNIFVRGILYTKTNINTGKKVELSNLPYILLCTVLIFLSCALIEFIRSKISKFIKTRKIVVKQRKKFYNYIDKI